MTIDAHDVKAIRRLAPHYIGVAASGLTTTEMQGFIAGTFTPSEQQLTALAQLMRITTGENHDHE